MKDLVNRFVASNKQRSKLMQEYLTTLKEKNNSFVSSIPINLAEFQKDLRNFCREIDRKWDEKMIFLQTSQD